MIPVVEIGTVDGVRALRSASVTGRNAAALVFRVGRFDETLTVAGITHLVEHLTLSTRPKAAYQFNAEVTGRFTAFFMESADPAGTADFITTVCRGLAGDHRHGLDQEKRVLRTEAASRGGAGALGACLNERYGASGPGLAGYPEYGLHRLGWAEVEAWRHRWFTAGNALLWISGTVPRGLRLDLPPGPAPAAAPLRPLGLTLPGFAPGARGGIGLSLTGRLSDASAVTLDILQRRLTQVLRHERGLSYDVAAARERLDSDLFHAWLTADALPEQTSSVAHAMLTVFESLAGDGGTDDEVASYAQRLRGAYESPEGPVMVLHRQAQDMLYDRPARQPAKILEAAGQVGRGVVSDSASQLMSQMIVATPQLVPAVQGRMPQLPAWSAARVSGVTRGSRHSAASLTVGSQGVMLTPEEGHHVTVRFDATAALLLWNDEQRTLIGTDGFAVRLDPSEWPDGDAVVRSVDALVPPGLTVAIDGPGPERPRRDQAPAATATPADADAPRARPGVWRRIVRGLCFAVVAFGVLAITGGDVSGGIAFVVIGGLGLAWQLLSSQRRIRHHGS
jgi:zinc protease